MAVAICKPFLCWVAENILIYLCKAINEMGWVSSAYFLVHRPCRKTLPHVQQVIQREDWTRLNATALWPKFALQRKESFFQSGAKRREYKLASFLSNFPLRFQEKEIQRNCLKISHSPPWKICISLYETEILSVTALMYLSLAGYVSSRCPVVAAP